MPLTLTFDDAGRLRGFLVAGKHGQHGQLLSIVFPVLVSIKFGEDAVQRVGDDLQKQRMWMSIWERFSFFNYRAEKVIGFRMNVSLADASVLHSLLCALRNEFAAAGRLDEAFDCLDQAIAYRDPALVHLAVAPEWDSLRDDPRFAERLRSMALPSAAHDNIGN
jgi:hypothetical protein